MKTILYIITQSEIGGAQRYILDLASILKNQYKIGVVAGCTKKENKFSANLKNNGISYHCVPSLKRSISPFNDILTIFKLINIINKTKPSIIHLNSSKISILGSLAISLAKLKKTNKSIKTVYTSHGWVFNEPLSPIKKNFYRFAEKFTSSYKNAIICVNKHDLNIAKHELKINPNKLHLIHNGINTNTIKFHDKNTSLKILTNTIQHKINFNPNTIIIGSIGNLYATKDYINFIKAFKITKTALQVQVSVTLLIKAIIIGEGAERKKLENLIAQENLKDDIHLAGSIENASSLLKAFDIYVCSSIKEGLPYSILEAGSASLPIVSTNTGGTPDIIKDSTNGLLATPNNPENLAMQITKLIQNKELRTTYGSNIKNFVTQNFQLSDMINQTNKTYTSPTSTTPNSTVQ